MNVEDKNGNAVIKFNAGAFGAVVLKTIDNLKGLKNITINDEKLECLILEKTDKSKNSVETVLKFDNSERKVTVNIYKTQSKVMVNGKDYARFVSNFLQEYFSC